MSYVSCVTGLQQCLFILLCCYGCNKTFTPFITPLCPFAYPVSYLRGGWTFSDVLSFCFKLLFLLWDGIPKVGANIPTWNLNFLVLFYFRNITVCFFSLISWLGFSPVTAKTFGDNLAVSVGFAGHLLSLLHPH